MPELIAELNRESLRRASVYDDGNLVGFTLTPPPKDLLPFLEEKNSDWVMRDSVWVYRRLRSATDEIKLMSGLPCVDQDIKPVAFEALPDFKLFWEDSGHSVALFLNGEPWAFICNETHQGYSKGMLTSESGEPWDQELFEKTFLK